MSLVGGMPDIAKQVPIAGWGKARWQQGMWPDMPAADASPPFEPAVFETSVLH